MWMCASSALRASSASSEGIVACGATPLSSAMVANCTQWCAIIAPGGCGCSAKLSSATDTCSIYRE